MDNLDCEYGYHLGVSDGHWPHKRYGVFLPCCWRDIGWCGSNLNTVDVNAIWSAFVSAFTRRHAWRHAAFALVESAGVLGWLGVDWIPRRTKHRRRGNLDDSRNSYDDVVCDGRSDKWHRTQRSSVRPKCRRTRHAVCSRDIDSVCSTGSAYRSRCNRWAESGVTDVECAVDNWWLSDHWLPHRKLHERWINVVYDDR